jgi:hypothetical protein
VVRARYIQCISEVNWLANGLEREHLGDLGENKRMVIKTVLTEIRCEVVRVELIFSEQNLMEGFCEYIYIYSLTYVAELS